jgi:hypothetical protein
LKRILAVLTIAALGMLASDLLRAQENPFVGTWKLNLAKSKFTDTPAPKSETRTVTAQGSGLKFSFDGVGADGSPISWSYTSELDGKAVPVTGSGIPSGADMLVTKRVDANTLTTTYLKAGKAVRTSRTMVSQDGKLTTVTGRSVGTSGKSTTVVSVWDKQ